MCYYSPGQPQPFWPGGGELSEAVLWWTFGRRGRGKSKITSLCFCKVHHQSHAVDKMAADSVAVERSLWNMSRQQTGRASRSGRQHAPWLNSDPWTGRGDKSHHKWYLMSRCEYYVHWRFSFCFRPFDSAWVNRDAVTSPDPTPLRLRSINPRAFYFYMRAQESQKRNQI